jgi:nucleoside-diphosphate-sugar epimerase
MNRFKVENKTADIVVKGKPEKTWAWVHITDLATAYTSIVNAAPSVVGGQIFNISDATRVTYVEVFTYASS